MCFILEYNYSLGPNFEQDGAVKEEKRPCPHFE